MDEKTIRAKMARNEKLTPEEFAAAMSFQQFNAEKQDKMSEINEEEKKVADMIRKDSTPEDEKEKQFAALLKNRPDAGEAADERTEENNEEKAALKEKLGKLSEGMDEGSKKADAQIASSSRSAESYGARMMQEGSRDSLAESLERMKRSRR